MMADEAVRLEWETALEDPDFAETRGARYMWWYQRTPYWDETVGLLPVYPGHDTQSTSSPSRKPTSESGRQRTYGAGRPWGGRWQTIIEGQSLRNSRSIRICGQDEATDVEEYYRPDHQELPEIEVRALTLCRGRALDLGAGAGRHALELQRRGLPVTALDVAPEAIEVMRERGVRDPRCGSLEAVEGEKFGSILLLMHGIGVVGTLDGLAAFLESSRDLLDDGGQIICDSADLATVMPALLEETLGDGDGAGGLLRRGGVSALLRRRNGPTVPVALRGFRHPHPVWKRGRL